MKLKRLFAMLLSLCMVFALCACSAEPLVSNVTPPAKQPTVPSGPSSITPLLFQVTDAKGNTAWLFGSIHVGRDDFYPLPDYVYNAFNEADAAAFELDALAFESDLNAQIDALQLMVYTDGSTIKDHLSEENYNKAVEIMTEAGYYTQLLDTYNIVMWQMLLDELLYMDLGFDLENGIDRYLTQKAYDEKKPVYEVESVRFQYQMLCNYSPALQEMLLESSIASWDEPDSIQESMDSLMDAWASGDEASLATLLASEAEGLTEEEQALYAEYHKAMATDRNIGMADYTERALASGEKVFICVGAAHVVGEGGIVDLLQARGYTVTCIGGAALDQAA